MSLRLFLVNDTAALAHTGADRVTALIRERSSAALVLATGNTPMAMYAALAGRYQQGEFNTSHLRIFQLDEYWGISPDDRRSLYGWTKRAILDPWRIPAANFVRLPGDAADPLAVCRAYDEAITAVGRFDLAVLGLGPNGHLGFNEPPADPGLPTRLVNLTEASIKSNAVYWGGRDEVPRQALTAGMDCLLAARQILLLVSGAHKHPILRQTVEGPVTADVPASFLQQAADVTVIADKAAWYGESARKPPGGS